ncbi:MAG: phosphatidylinositol-specific phospholipase C [Planctomycetota bacterium]|nr:phosphatidylinositol-specific phospholipase C [Planctomycetota bacterium]
MKTWFPIFVLSLCLPTGLVADEGDWMSRLADGRKLSSLSIPGTHNSAALREPLPATARCQSLNLAKQLDAGVRFFDLRCCHQEDQFFLYHGPVSQKLSFDAVLKTMESFLHRHPGETLILSIKPEHRPRGNSRSFVETLRHYLDQPDRAWYRGETIPKLGEVRGKMILLRRFDAPSGFGIPATDWGHNGSHEGDRLFIQDRFKVPDAETKWKLVKRGLERTLSRPPVDRLHLHFSSGYQSGPLGIPNITAISNSVNRRLTDYLLQAPRRCHGCLVVDFMTPELARSIYQLNFPVDKTGQGP